MSTRANVIIRFGSSAIYVYRHHDGYLAGMGADLARKLEAAGNDYNRFVESLLSERYEKASYESAARRVYELTSDVHGDIEYLYEVRFESHSSRPPRIGYCFFPIGSSRQYDRPLVGDLEGFVSSVNAAIRDQNRRLAELKEKTPSVYGAYEPEPEIVLNNAASAAGGVS